MRRVTGVVGCHRVSPCVEEAAFSAVYNRGGRCRGICTCCWSTPEACRTSATKDRSCIEVSVVVKVFADDVSLC